VQKSKIEQPKKNLAKVDVGLSAAALLFSSTDVLKSARMSASDGNADIEVQRIPDL
jgi:hypothetical protein